MNAKFVLTIVLAAAAASGVTLLVIHRQAASSVRPAAVSAASSPRAALSPIVDRAAPAPTPLRDAARADTAPAGPSPETTALADDVESIISSRTSFADRQALWDKLRRGHQLDSVITLLKQLAADNPNDVEIPTQLGEAQVQKLRSVLAGEEGSPSDIPILALQADQQFDAALKLDPTLWEAQYAKATAMSHWPANLGRGPEVTTRLSQLIAQQEASANPPPEYANTYLVLGQQYQAAGNSAEALAVWQRGLSRFPASSALIQSLSRPPANP